VKVKTIWDLKLTKVSPSPPQDLLTLSQWDLGGDLAAKCDWPWQKKVMRQIAIAVEYR